MTGPAGRRSCGCLPLGLRRRAGGLGVLDSSLERVVGRFGCAVHSAKAEEVFRGALAVSEISIRIPEERSHARAVLSAGLNRVRRRVRPGKPHQLGMGRVTESS